MATADKNKNEQNLSVESRLKSLYELQTLLSQIDRIRTVRGELPLEVADLEDVIKGLTTRIENFRKEIEEIRKKSVAEKEKINDSQAKIAKYKEQIDNVRNNREFDLLSKEIEFQTLEIELSEKHINEYARMIDAKNNEIAETEERLADQKHVLADKKAELDEIVSETKQDEERLREQAKALEPKIDARTLAARCLRRLLQPYSAPETDGDQDAQEDHRLRILRPHHDRPRSGRRGSHRLHRIKMIF